ncbi:hypothetical protein PO883_00355 [Massilia sp. DJPM01]|uniref:hypothetical protein n=1 Tax=Massilia sp. DJPM01 TaxID=3024404 RepID=UPI00259EE9B5|nr:hypothetical protein [Massilia sp. DJPM01]MDM5175662.1 hypothetical protein [Massilia sp. DJPM01]
MRWRSNRLPRSAASAVETSNGSNAVIHQNIVVQVEATAQAPMLTLAPGLAPLSRSLVDTSWLR